MRALPQPHAGRHIACAILAKGAHLRLKLVERVFKAAEPVAGGIEPGRCQDHRGGEQLVARQLAFTPRDGVFVRCQTPARIEGLAEDAGSVTGKDRLEPHLGRHGIDRDRSVQQVPDRHRTL